MKKTVLLAGCLLLTAVSSHAQYDYMNSVQGRWGLAGNLGYALYAMNDVNTGISEINTPIISLGGVPLEKIAGGLNFNGSVFYGVADYMLMGLEIGGLQAYSENEPFPGASQSFNLAGLEFGVFAKIAVPMEETFLWTIGFSLIAVATSEAEYYAQGAGGTSVTTFKGSTTGFKIAVGGEWFLSPYFGLGADAGYRYAKIDEVTDRDERIRWLNSDGSNMTIDYSGPYAQGGLRVYF